ncbi:hypothetical protein [Streptomyces sp. NPDC091212]|uniref:hypothetical protein n=1 Tax=Streptomyces sp. NPDC091212 TaxID=3155191 RepID=UPI00343D736D
MTTQDLSEAQRQLADAQAEKTELDGLIEGLEAQVLAGEEEAAAKQLGEKWSLRRLAELRRQRADRRLKEAEAADLARRQSEARKAAAVDLETLAVGVVFEKYRAALVAVDDFMTVCAAREGAILTHSRALEAVGDKQMLVDTGDSRIMLDLPGERFECGRYEPSNMVTRMTGAVAVARLPANHRAGIRGVAVRPEGVHPVERLLAEAAGENERSFEVGWSSNQWAARLLDHAAKTAGGEA